MGEAERNRNYWPERRSRRRVRTAIASRREVPSEVRTCSRATVLGLFTRDCRSTVPGAASARLIHGQPASTVRESPAQGSRARGEFAPRLFAADPNLSRVQTRGRWFPTVTEGAHD